MLRRLFRSKKPVKTFTYYIPAPPQRTTGYREKAFDKITYELIKQGHEIIDFKLQQMSGNNSTGVLVIFLLAANSEKSAQLNLNFDTEFGLDNNPEGDIELD